MTWRNCAKSLFPELTNTVETMPQLASQKRVQKNKASKKENSKQAGKSVVQQKTAKAVKKAGSKKLGN
jgi:hypothetical protein